MTKEAVATCDRALPPSSDAPEWVHLLPAGHIVARDGREFDLPDPTALLAAFDKGGIDLPIDYEHQVDSPEAKLKGPIPAAGWIKELSFNEAGLWGRVEWTATARELIARKEYRFLSPSFMHSKAGEILRLNGAGLVHRPALHLKALASQEPTMSDSSPSPTPPGATLMARLKKLLKLASDATEEEALDALEQTLERAPGGADPARSVPVDAVAAMVRDRRVELATLAEAQVLSKVNAAMNGGYFPPALRDWALALCRSDPASFDDFVRNTAPPYAHLFRAVLPGSPPSSERSRDVSEAESAVCAQLGLRPEQLA